MGTGDLNTLWQSHQIYPSPNSPCHTTPYELASTSGATTPDFWKEPALEGPAYREFSLEWHCCHCVPKGSRRVNAYAVPPGKITSFPLP